MNKKNIALLILLLTAVVGGGNPVFVKIGLTQIPPFSFLFLRCLLSLVILLPFCYKEITKFRARAKNLVAVSLLACVNIILFNLAISGTSATTGQVIYSAVPLIVAIFSSLLLKEKVGAGKILGIVIGLVGVLLIIFFPIQTNHSDVSFSLLPNLLILVAATSFSLYTIFSKNLLKDYSPFLITASFIFLTAIFSFPLSVAEFYLNNQWWTEVAINSWGSLLYVGLLGTLVLYLLYQFIIKYTSPVYASMLSYVSPVITFVWAYFLLGEKLSLLMVIGAVVTLTGVWITTHEK